ncbi:hypothetical protein, partial [Clostridium perfringens]|uniref:hypothetical protein n=1 Tax=Clostridium perfringens TaxID=1502 RepID=UPI003753FE77
DPAKERDFQRALLEIVLDHHTGVEGGFWKRAKGFVAYAYPTYEGTGAKRDVPEAERPALSELAESSVAAGELRDTTRRGSREAIVTTACPIRAAT